MWVWRAPLIPLEYGCGRFGPRSSKFPYMAIYADLFGLHECVPPCAKLVSVLHRPCHGVISILYKELLQDLRAAAIGQLGWQPQSVAAVSSGDRSAQYERLATVLFALF